MPLNPVLYGRLREEFGRVSIAQEGVAASFTHTAGLLDSRMRMHMSNSGEYYRVGCPFCGDSRGRLWINHLFGVPDEVTGSKNLWLAICYNESCLSNPGRAQELYDRVYGFQNAALRGQKLVILPGEVESQVLKEVPLPGTTLRLDHIPPTDPVCNYLRSRGLDPVFLGETFDLSYCLDASRDYPMTNGRIVIPIVMKGMLVGWQCRYVGDIDWKARNIPKYYNLPNMPRRLMLYNFDKAKKFPYVVITEGPADAWSVGEPAIATFGKHVSTPQTQLIAETWPQTIIILLDGDAWKDAEELVERFKQGQYKGTIVPVRLPPEKDPGALDHSYLWECIYQECEKAGVDLQSLKRDDNDTNHIPRSRYRSPARVDDTRGPMEQQPVPEYSFDQPRNA